MDRKIRELFAAKAERNKHYSRAHFLRDFGHVWGITTPVPDWMDRERSGTLYRATRDEWKRSTKRKSRKLRYCEGTVFSPSLIGPELVDANHSWLIDETGAVIDLDSGVEADSIYFGVCFRDEIDARLFHREWGTLGNPSVFNKIRRKELDPQDLIDAP
jgi:hypothetical protein